MFAKKRSPPTRAANSSSTVRRNDVRAAHVSVSCLGTNGEPATSRNTDRRSSIKTNLMRDHLRLRSAMTSAARVRLLMS